jgi:pyoverdine/dityrosine biosynthesis protein Dit1
MLAGSRGGANKLLEDADGYVVDFGFVAGRRPTPGRQGRRYFTSEIEHFILRDTPLEFFLPAFPCKSSNGCRIGAKSWHFAVSTISSRGSSAITPGARLWIVSDGRVLSGCIE